MKIINLDQAVVNALNFFIENEPQSINLKNFKFPLVAGSGNAYHTCLILFADQPAIIGNENNFAHQAKSYQPLINKGLTKEVVVVSASGEKDSIWQVELGKKLGLKTYLLTCSAKSSAAKIADKVYVFKKVTEPYTYNVSTYLGMMLGKTKERPQQILKFLNNLKLPANFKKYQSYSFILPDQYSAIAPMLEIKASELFGSRFSLRAFGEGEARHAKYVIPWEKELVITIGNNNKYLGNEQARWNIKLPKNHNIALIMALTYYIVGKIQIAKPAYFKNNIASYCNLEPKLFNKKKPTNIIVPGN